MQNYCFVFSYKWGKWGGLIEQNFESPEENLFNGSEGGKHIRIVQEIECEECGLKKRRFVQSHEKEMSDAFKIFIGFLIGWIIFYIFQGLSDNVAEESKYWRGFSGNVYRLDKLSR